MRRPMHALAIPVLLVTLVGAAGRDAAAQVMPTLKVVNDSATIRIRPTFLSAVVAKVKEGTLLEALDLEDDWYWVILPRDEHGTRLPGWVRTHDVEVVAPGDPTEVLHHFTEAVEEAKARKDKEAAEQEARLEAARQRVEEARKEYEAVVTKGANGSANAAATPASAAPAKAAAPAAASAKAPTQKAQPVQIDKTQKPTSAHVSRQYEWFGGYSFYRDQSESLSFPGGWMLSGGGRVKPAIDLVGEISGSHHSEGLFGLNLATTSMYTFAVGPKRSWPSRTHTAFAQVLAGFATIHSTTFGVDSSSTGFALQPGGGVDIPLAKTFAVRVGVDVEMVHASSGWFSGFRINTGLLFLTGLAK